MRKLLACFVLVLTSPLIVTAAEGLNIETGSVDLLKSEVLSEPFTVFDQLLYSLGKGAAENKQYLRPENGDFRPSKLNRDVSTEVRYEKGNMRVGVIFEVWVSGMNDPWRDVCKRHVETMASLLGVEGLGSQIKHPNPELKASQLHLFFSKYLGPKWSPDDMPVASLQPFVDSMVLIGSYWVEGKRGLAFRRHCALHINNDHMTYQEHKY
jgi:hypothetical protein